MELWLAYYYYLPGPAQLFRGHGPINSLAETEACHGPYRNIGKQKTLRQYTGYYNFSQVVFHFSLFNYFIYQIFRNSRPVIIKHN